MRFAALNSVSGPAGAGSVCDSAPLYSRAGKHGGASVGKIAGSSASAAAKGTIPGAVGFALLVLGICMKARVEEQWLTQERGNHVYEVYGKRVPMLLPIGRRG